MEPKKNKSITIPCVSQQFHLVKKPFGNAIIRDGKNDYLSDLLGIACVLF